MSWELVAARVLPGWAWRAFQRAMNRPRPDPRILALTPAGRGGAYVDFTADVVNYGTQQCRCEITAQVGEQAVECHPAKVDLIPDKPPLAVRVIIPRPELGDLVEQFDDAPTLYDQTLRIEATDGTRHASLEWHEEVYTMEANPERFQIQQRVWRRGRGEETPNDLRVEAREKRIKRLEERGEDGSPYDLV